MALTKLTEDVSQISKLGNHPNSDNGLDSDALKAWFDKAPESIKTFLNTILIPELEARFGTLETWATLADKKFDNFTAGTGFLSIFGGSMSGAVDMAGNAISGLPNPEADEDAANKGYADQVAADTLGKAEEASKSYADGKYWSVKATLAKDGWVNKLQTVVVNGVSADEDSMDIYPAADAGDYDNFSAYGAAGVVAAKQMNDGVVFRCETVPDRDLDVNISCMIKGPATLTGATLQLVDGILTIS